MRSTKFVVIFLLVSLAAVPAFAQNATDCASLMKFGIYDKFKTFSTEIHYKQVKEFFSNYQFSNRQQAESKANELGLDIMDVLSLNFNGKNSTSNFEQWKQELIKNSYQEALSTGLKAETIEKISNSLTELVGKCLTQKGVHAYVIPSNDNQNFSITVDFVPTSGDRPRTQGNVTMTPPSVAALCAPAGFLGKKVEIGPEGISFSCRRLPTETVTIVVNTKDGSPTIHYDAYVVPKPSISFSATTDIIKAGESTRLMWTVTNASRVELEGSGQVADSSSKDVTPTQTTDYRLIVTSLDGKQTSTYQRITVIPQPVLTFAQVHFHTTDDDKDDDTHITVSVICSGNTVANVAGTWGKFDDNSDSGWKKLAIIEQIKKEAVIGVCTARLIEAPKGKDEWHFNWSLELTFSEGTPKRYDWCCGNVDHNRTTINQGL